MSDQYREAGAATPRLLLTVHAPVDADLEELDRASRRLLAELRELDLDWTTLRESTMPPQGSKGVDTRLGAVRISLSSAAVVSPVIEAVREWLSRREDGSTVTLTVDGHTIALDSTSDEAQQDLVEAFIRLQGCD
jgi:Effector Associated Constant Component 1